MPLKTPTHPLLSRLQREAAPRDRESALDAAAPAMLVSMTIMAHKFNCEAGHGSCDTDIFRQSRYGNKKTHQSRAVGILEVKNRSPEGLEGACGGRAIMTVSMGRMES